MYSRMQEKQKEFPLTPPHHTITMGLWMFNDCIVHRRSRRLRQLNVYTLRWMHQKYRFSRISQTLSTLLKIVHCIVPNSSSYAICIIHMFKMCIANNVSLEIVNQNDWGTISREHTQSYCLIAFLWSCCCFFVNCMQYFGVHQFQFQFHLNPKQSNAMTVCAQYKFGCWCLLLLCQIV